MFNIMGDLGDSEHPSAFYLCMKSKVQHLH